MTYLEAWCAENGYLAAAELADSRVVFVNATVTAGEIGAGTYASVRERFDYASFASALHAWTAWEGRGFAGEPRNWIRHRPSNRRRRMLTERLLYEWVAP